VWMDIATYYTNLDPDLFQMPDREQLQHRFDELALRELHAQADDAAWVAETDGQIAGLLFARLEPPLASAGRQLLPDLARTRLIVEALGVRTRFWRRGIGRLLLEQAEGWGRSRGATLVLLDTYIHSPVSVPFYENGMGYAQRSLHLRKSLV
jgi:GNAT superfamily N-acetyltransferase